MDSAALTTEAHQQLRGQLMRPDGQEDLCFAVWRPSQGDRRKSAIATYTQDGDWIVGKNVTVGADDQTTTGSNRFKRDGKEYPYQSPAAGSGTIAVKPIDENTAEATIKTRTSNMTVRTTISKDGKTFIRTMKGTDAQGRQVNNRLVYEKQ